MVIAGVMLSTLAPRLAAAMPRAGSNELRLESSYVLQGMPAAGLTHYSEGSYGLTTFGAGFALGRFLTDNFEVGASVDFMYMGSATSSSSIISPGIAPFVRVFSPVADNIGIYASATLGIQVLIPDEGKNVKIVNLGGDVGAEFFIGDAWSLRAGPMYRYMESLSSGGGSLKAYGVNWAIAGYF
jgi:hypothetical protein